MVAPAPDVLTPNAHLPLVDKGGLLTSHGLQMLQQLSKLATGSVPVVPSTAVHTSNHVALTPYSNSPQFGKYNDGQSFPFMATATTTGLVTATVVPPTGILETLPVYKSNGGTQAGSGDIVNGRVYSATFHSGLNSGSGGFLLS